MALNVKNIAVERLVAEVARLPGELKTEAVRRALEERKARLACLVVGADRVSRLRRCSAWIENAGGFIDPCREPCQPAAENAVIGVDGCSGQLFALALPLP